MSWISFCIGFAAGLLAFIVARLVARYHAWRYGPPDEREYPFMTHLPSAEDGSQSPDNLRGTIATLETQVAALKAKIERLRSVEVTATPSEAEPKTPDAHTSAVPPVVMPRFERSHRKTHLVIE